MKHSKNVSRFAGLSSFFTLWFGQTVSQLGSDMTTLALSIWAYSQQGNVMSVSLLLVCKFVPAAIVSLFAGVLADRFSQKTVMMIADSVAAVISACVLIFYYTGTLTIGVLYGVNALLGLCNALQGPASQVAITLITPKEQYMRVSGLQSFSGSLCGILSPVLATALIAFGGLGAVLLTDLATFAVGFVTLILTRIPAAPREERKDEPYFRQLRAGLRFIRGSRFIRVLMGYHWMINFVAGIAFFSVLNPMILARTGGNEMILGYVNSFIAIGTMAGALIMTLWKPAMDKRRLMVLMYTLSFAACDFFMGVGRSPVVWCLAGFLGNMSLPYGDGALSTLYRENIPVRIQGRVFAARGAGINLSVLAGYLIGALLADHVVQPLCDMPNFLGSAFRFLVGEGPGRAMGLIFVMTGLTGTISSAVVGRKLARTAGEPDERLAD